MHHDMIRETLLSVLDLLRDSLAGDALAGVIPAASQRRPATVNERMLGMLEADPERIGWSARKWASALGCTAGAVHAAPAWRRIMTARALNQAGRAERAA